MDPSEIDRNHLDRRTLLKTAGGAAGLTLAGRQGLVAAGPSHGPLIRRSLLQAAKTGGTLISATNDSPTGLDPHSVALLANFRITRLMYNSVVHLDNDLTPVPSLAESWETPDNLTYIFHLRKGVKFHSGREMDAGDVKYSLERILDEATGAWARGSFTVVSAIDTPDASTLKLTLKSPFSGLIAAMYNLLVVPKEVADQPHDYLMQHANGTGPFMLDTWTPQVEVKLKRHPEFWQQGLPYLDGVTIRMIPDENSVLAALRTGDVDHYILNDNKNFADLQKEGKLTLATVPALGTIVVNINHRKEPLSNLKVRQALSMAMNRDEILQVAGANVGVVAGPIPPTHKLYSVPIDQLAFYKQDVNGAKALLAEAGYADKLALDILYIPTYPFTELAAVTLAAQWQAIGVNAQPRATELGVWLDLRTKTFDYWISTNADFPTIDPDVYLYDTFHTGSEPAVWDAWSDPEIDALLEQGHATVDIPKRQELFATIQKMLVERCAAYWTYASSHVNVLQPYVTDFVPHPSGYPFGFEKIWLNK
jgi:peptide/nickel transport system substrate-binding protein